MFIIRPAQRKKILKLVAAGTRETISQARCKKRDIQMNSKEDNCDVVQEN